MDSVDSIREYFGGNFLFNYFYNIYKIHDHCKAHVSCANKSIFPGIFRFSKFDLEIDFKDIRILGKNIFVTGGSGFLGKALIEKLLRSCPNIGNIYILLRPKKGKYLHDRVQQILSSPVSIIIFDFAIHFEMRLFKILQPIHK